MERLISGYKTDKDQDEMGTPEYRMEMRTGAVTNWRGPLMKVDVLAMNNIFCLIRRKVQV